MCHVQPSTSRGQPDRRTSSRSMLGHAKLPASRPYTVSPHSPYLSLLEDIPIRTLEKNSGSQQTETFLKLAATCAIASSQDGTKHLKEGSRAPPRPAQGCLSFMPCALTLLSKHYPRHAARGQQCSKISSKGQIGKFEPLEWWLLVACLRPVQPGGPSPLGPPRGQRDKTL